MKGLAEVWFSVLPQAYGIFLHLATVTFLPQLSLPQPQGQEQTVCRSQIESKVLLTHVHESTQRYSRCADVLRQENLLKDLLDPKCTTMALTLNF